MTFDRSVRCDGPAVPPRLPPGKPEGLNVCFSHKADMNAPNAVRHSTDTVTELL